MCRQCVLDDCVGEDNRRCLIAIARRHGLSASEATPLVKTVAFWQMEVKHYTNLVIQIRARKACLRKERGNDDVRSVV